MNFKNYYVLVHMDMISEQNSRSVFKSSQVVLVHMDMISEQNC